MKRSLDDLIRQITTDAHGEDEQFRAFRQAFHDKLAFPCDAFVIGEPVSVVAFEYEGNQRRGLTARCLRDRREHVVAAADVAFPPGTDAERLAGAYRQWMGLPPLPATLRKAERETASTIDPDEVVELAVLSVKQLAARCRILGSGQNVTLRARRLWDAVPGEIIRVEPRKQWTYAGNPYLSGDIVSTRIDAKALGLIPLRLEDLGTWDPENHYWGEEGQPIERWARPIIAHGPRPAFEMEQVLPGYNYEDPELDPIGQANDHKDAGDFKGAYRILMDLCQADLRCLDAHSHLGNLAFDGLPQDAIRHYEVGFRIGELSLPEGFSGLLPWGHIDNRPFLRCMHGFGLCLWRLGRFAEAALVFRRLLWLNPSDNQGVRFLITDVRAKRNWEDRRDR